MSASEKLIVFVKAPIRGTVKTRLAKALGDDAALEIYLSLVQAVLGKIAPATGVELRYTPDGSAERIQSWLRTDWSLAPQGDGDLGERMHRAFASAFVAGAERVVLIGSDSPEITHQDILDAWQSLRDHDVALGPAIDGGYWLIGLRAPQPRLLERMRWSTNDVLAETILRARFHSLSTHLLRQLPDIDTAEDWEAFQSRRTTPAPTAP